MTEQVSAGKLQAQSDISLRLLWKKIAGLVLGMCHDRHP
jgi:hypothetical protein